MGRDTRGKPYLKNGICIEIALGYKCNLQCKYCYEKDIDRNNKPDISNDILYKTFEYIDYIKQYENFIVVSFWGGEPLLYDDKIKKYFDRYINDNNIFFQFNTNTLNLINFIENVDDKIKKRLYLCISYDYLPLNDKNRILLKSVKSSTEYVVESLTYINRIKDKFKRVVIRSACFNCDLENSLFDTYMNFIEHRIKYPNCINNLMLTPNFYHKNDICDLNKIKEQLQKINKYLIENKIDDPKFNFYFLDKENNFKTSACGFGRSTLFIDSDGKIYPCHGCSYRCEKSRYCLGNIKDDITFDDLSKKIVNEIVVETTPKKCKNCKNTFCIFCFLQQNMNKNQSLPNLVMDQACSNEEFKFYQTISDTVAEYFKIRDTWK